MDVRFASNALSVRSRFLKVFPFAELADVDSVVVYSYWFFTGAALAGMVRKEIERYCPSTIVSRAHAYDIDEEAAPRQYIPSRRFVMGAVDRVFSIFDCAAGFLSRHFRTGCRRCPCDDSEYLGPTSANVVPVIRSRLCHAPTWPRKSASTCWS